MEEADRQAHQEQDASCGEANPLASLTLEFDRAAFDDDEGVSPFRLPVRARAECGNRNPAEPEAAIRGIQELARAPVTPSASAAARMPGRGQVG